MEKEYIVKAVFSDGFTLFLAHLFGGYHVMATDEKRTFCYSVFGAYSRIGNASRKLKAVARQHKSADNSLTLYHASKQFLDENGAFCDESN